MLFPRLAERADVEAVRFGSRALSYAELDTITGELAATLGDTGGPVAVLAEARLETAVAVLAALLAGVPAVPVNPASGTRELEHIRRDSAVTRLLCAPDTAVPEPLNDIARVDVGATTGTGTVRQEPAEPRSDAPALIVYTSGTTGAPKGVVLPRSAVRSSLDALADAWHWDAGDVVLHGLPLFHVHGLILGVLGPLRRGGTVHHLGRFTPDALGDALREWQGNRPVVVFGVPTNYTRLADAAESDPGLARAIGTARLLVSGSAALPEREHHRLTRLTGHHVIERYGMTETLMNTSVRVDGPHRPGTVGVPLDGVALRIVDESGTPIDARDGSTIGEIQVCGPNLFTEYLHRPDATAEAFDGEWFRTGDMATVDGDGYVRIVGRKATDLINSGGYKIGAGEIENALGEHPGVAEVAVTGEPDADLGERIVAWVVPAGECPGAEELSNHVAGILAPHKRPREVRFLDALPRNDLGKVTKRALGT
ncbi:AMP-binding protein [Haloechinothrix sp. YIM 98757]|uniref:AMP-binding protein n=1 Tax=Haloechinothrix aidingensis TaxID=2752311 RepID=A0A838A8G6_9PSEU|nr:AMP-binding protein [Haloechinothrix aidingensis]MBA0124781.1 AMP-binding protein [Haloechinothrix aidingensis]